MKTSYSVAQTARGIVFSIGDQRFTLKDTDESFESSTDDREHNAWMIRMLKLALAKLAGEE